MNYFSENIKLNEIISTQKMMIAKLQRENDECNKVIVNLTNRNAHKFEIEMYKKNAGCLPAFFFEFLRLSGGAG